MKSNDMEMKQKCVCILQANGTQKHCLNVLKALYQKLNEEARKIGANPYIEMALKEMEDF